MLKWWADPYLGSVCRKLTPPKGISVKLWLRSEMSIKNDAKFCCFLKGTYTNRSNNFKKSVEQQVPLSRDHYKIKKKIIKMAIWYNAEVLAYYSFNPLKLEKSEFWDP